MTTLFKFISVAASNIGDTTGVRDASRYIEKAPAALAIVRKQGAARRAEAVKLLKQGLPTARADAEFRKLLRLAEQFKGRASIDRAAFESAVQAIFGDAPTALASTARFQRLASAVYLSLFITRQAAGALSPRTHGQIVIASRACSLVEFAAAADETTAVVLKNPSVLMITFKSLLGGKSGPVSVQVGAPVKTAPAATLAPAVPDYEGALAAVRHAMTHTLPEATQVSDDGVKPRDGSAKTLNATRRLIPRDGWGLFKDRAWQSDTFEGLLEMEKHLLRRKGAAKMAQRKQLRASKTRWSPITGGGFIGSSLLPNPPSFAGPSTPTYIPGAPTTVGKPNVIGEGLLMRVEDKIIGYEPAAIARVINIPARATKSDERTLRLSSTTQVEEESAESRTTERSVQSDERFALQTKAAEQISSEMAMKSAGGFSGTYGPVSASASTEASITLAASSSRETASDYAKSVVEKAVEAVTASTRSVRRFTETRESTDVAKEGFDNSAGGDATTILRWVDEVHEGRLLNYDSRQLMEFYIPRPGAVMLWSTSAARSDGLPEPPPKPELSLEDIEPYAYDDYLEDYGVTDAPPPPESYRFVSKTLVINEDIKDQTNTRKHSLKTDESLVIPEGYELQTFWALINATQPRDGYLKKNDPDGLVNARYLLTVGVHEYKLLGRRFERWAKTHVEEKDGYIRPRVGTVPITLTGVEDRAATATVVLRCAPTEQLMVQWRQGVYAAIQRGYERKLREYEDRLNAASYEASPALQARNPEQNRAREREELKRAAIAQLTAQHFHSFGAIASRGAASPPEVRFDEARVEGEYVEFFERAIEWTQMEYLLYPYFWDNPDDGWLRALTMTHDDPKHEEFLKAGYCRVVVPVRPGFEGAILTYLSNPDRPVIWDDRSLADIDMDEDLYFPIWRAIMERQGQTQTEPVQVGKSWRYRIPTGHQVISPTGLPPVPAP